ncbi:hypothetical protein IAT38_002792 [Cryptococcus sp. DSM 104549]
MSPEAHETPSAYLARRMKQWMEDQVGKNGWEDKGRTVLETIGRGGMGVVKRAIHTDGTLCALKLSPRGLLNDRAESETMRYLRKQYPDGHPHIIRYLDSWRRGDRSIVAFEYAEKGDLSKVISSSPTGLHPSCAQRYFSQLACAISTYHDVGLYHMDLKPENLLLVNDSGGATVLKVADFGLGRRVEGDVEQAPARFCSGTYGYRSPEYSNNKPWHNGAYDIWAMGVILFQLLFGTHPFVPEYDWRKSDEKRDLPKYLREMGYYKIPRKDLGQAGDLLRKMMERDPAKRITMREIMLHPYITLSKSDSASVSQSLQQLENAALHAPSLPHPWRSARIVSCASDTLSALRLPNRKPKLRALSTALPAGTTEQQGEAKQPKRNGHPSHPPPTPTPPLLPSPPPKPQPPAPTKHPPLTFSAAPRAVALNARAAAEPSFPADWGERGGEHSFSSPTRGGARWPPAKRVHPRKRKRRKKPSVTAAPVRAPVQAALPRSPAVVPGLAWPRCGVG